MVRTVPNASPNMMVTAKDTQNTSCDKGAMPARKAGENGWLSPTTRGKPGKTARHIHRHLQAPAWDACFNFRDRKHPIKGLKRQGRTEHHKGHLIAGSRQHHLAALL
jgi:hypothetical protein